MDGSHLSRKEQHAVEIFSERMKALLMDNLVSIKLFGSKVRGDFNADSDIDILIVVKEKDFHLREKIYDVLLDIDLEFDPRISLKIFSEKEITINKQLKSPFIFNIEREGVTL